jgi:broad specificity phosphatase PhoE
MVPPMKAVVHLVRHGKVENPKGVIYGRLPGYNLSELGREQAEAAAEHLSSRNLGAVWASPLERAQETAEVIAARHGLTVVTDDRLIESDTTLEGVGRNILALLRSPKSWWSMRNPFTPSWGESYQDIKARMLEVIWEAVGEAGGGEIAFVAHQTPVQVAQLALRGVRFFPPWAPRVVPCSTGSVATMELDGQRLLSASYWVPPV